MHAEQIPEGYVYVSRRFEGRFPSRFFSPVTPDPRVVPELSLFDSPEEQRKKLAQHERHLRKLMARIRRDAVITGKAGRKPEPETLELYQSHFIERKPWKVCFEELWSKPGRKAPVPTERAQVKRRLSQRTRDYARAHPVPVWAAA